LTLKCEKKSQNLSFKHFSVEKSVETILLERLSRKGLKRLCEKSVGIYDQKTRFKIFEFWGIA